MLELNEVPLRIQGGVQLVGRTAVMSHTVPRQWCRRGWTLVRRVDSELQWPGMSFPGRTVWWHLVIILTALHFSILLVDDFIFP